MRWVLLLVFASGVLIANGNSNSLEEDDGFRRLLRRASIEADRPLIREERRNKDEEDEDSLSDIFEKKPDASLLVRNRREEEDKFYQTLLSRSEPKHKDKRAFDTEDSESKKGNLVREDWTGGDSKISDADREELTSLFQKLNADTGEQKDVFARSTSENDVSVDGAAQDYARWLLTQPANEIGKALSHKAEVDHKLTKLFFESKRGSISKHNNATKRGKMDDEDYPTKVIYPEPVHWKTKKKSEAPRTDSAVKSSIVPENCTTGECICRKSCLPRKALSFFPCECSEGWQNKPAVQLAKTVAKKFTAFLLPHKSSDKASKTLAAFGPKLCNDDSPHCLCTRACYPRGIAVLYPCRCEGDLKMNETLLQNATAQEFASVKALKATLQQKTVVKTHTLNVSSIRTVDPLAISWCSQACGGLHAVANENPCKCSQIPSNKTVVLAADPNIVHFPPRAPELTNPVSAMVSNSNLPGAVTAANNVFFPVPNIPATLIGNHQVNNPVSPVIIGASQKKVASPITSSLEPVHSVGIQQAPLIVSTPQISPNVNVKGSIRTTGDTPALSICARSCYPNKVGTDHPCTCVRNATVRYENLLKNQSLEKIKKHYQGCFKDRRPNRDLPKRFTRYETTPEACINECQYQGFKFAGVQYGYLCFCGNGFGRYGRAKDSVCNVACMGDATRTCGAFWHNAVYSVDGKEYDPSDFDFEKLDKEMVARDSLASISQANNLQGTNRNLYNSQGANVASHLMKAAQAALKAAKKLLPGISKKTKVAKKGDKVKREDSEDDEILQEKMLAEASLSAVRQIIHKTNFGIEKRDSEREKRAIDEDSESYDPNNGRDLLVAYMQNVDLYRRQVRSVDEEEEDYDPNEQKRFEYKRMTIGENSDGEFVERNDDENKPQKSLDKKDKTYEDKASLLLPVTDDLDTVTKRTVSTEDHPESKQMVSLENDKLPAKRAVSAENTKKHSLVINDDNFSKKRKRRSLDEENQLYANHDIKLEKASPVFTEKEKFSELPEKRVDIPMEKTNNEQLIKADENGDEDEEDDEPSDDYDVSGSGEEVDEDENISNNESGSESDDSEVHVSRRDIESDMEGLFVKRDLGSDKTNASTVMNSTLEDTTVDANLKSDVEKGVDSLLNLVVELYKQQKTIKAFESSVRSLRHDILKELHVPKFQKDQTTKKVREQIQKTARERLRVLTTSIENKISEFAKSHPEASRQANLAASLLPKLPLSQRSLIETKKEIIRRAAEFDNVEDTFNDNKIPDILKEHFKRNAEPDFEDSRPRRKIFKGEEQLSRMHRDVQEIEHEMANEKDGDDEEFDQLF
ncbi:uncharacterized protein LOC100198865 isoform X4 [Hydra vulgaris]|uniref:Uncharacterized protein LOC100198865 isoform X4 n=2 Tax=Hydra vulgaris TaxID=6087 RepID=A0ABM4CGC5_HYDVU